MDNPENILEQKLELLNTKILDLYKKIKVLTELREKKKKITTWQITFFMVYYVCKRKKNKKKEWCEWKKYFGFHNIS